MEMKLIQKHWLHGTQIFELEDDVIRMHLKPRFKAEKKLDVVLSILNPEPVLNNSRLEFHSRVKCGPLISLYLNKPNPSEFNTFVAAIKDQALQDYQAFAGLK